jgi:hypothetical protein
VLSRDFIGPIQKSSVDAIHIVHAARLYGPPEAQHHRHTTFSWPGKKLSKELGEGSFWVESTPRKEKRISRKGAKLAKKKEIKSLEFKD